MRNSDRVLLGELVWSKRKCRNAVCVERGIRWGQEERFNVSGLDCKDQRIGLAAMQSLNDANCRRLQESLSPACLLTPRCSVSLTPPNNFVAGPIVEGSVTPAGVYHWL